MIQYLYLFAGGVAGVFGRHFLASAIYRKWDGGLPIGTFIVNLSGCLLIGIFNSLAEQKMWMGPRERLLLMTGFCGGYTTFSALILESSNLVKDGKMGLALAYLSLSVLCGFLLFRVGAWAGKAI